MAHSPCVSYGSVERGRGGEISNGRSFAKQPVTNVNSDVDIAESDAWLTNTPAGRTRSWRPLGVFASVAAVACIYGASVHNGTDLGHPTAPALESSSKALRPTATATTTGIRDNNNADQEAYEVVISQRDFFDFPRVTEWLATKGLHRDSTQAELSSYIPLKIVVKGRPELIRGGRNNSKFGEDVMEGYNVFSIAYDNQTFQWDQERNSTFDKDTYSSAFTIVMDMRGNIVSLAPTMYDLVDGAWHRDDLHFIALKPYQLDPSYMVGVADIGTTEFGPAYLWNWKGDKPKTYVSLMNSSTSVDVHDIQVAFKADGFWVPYSVGSRDTPKGFQKISNDGQVLREHVWNHWYVDDPNHVQLIEEDQVAIVSSRITNSVLRINLGANGTDADIEWIMNGHNNSMMLFDEHGEPVPHGTWLFESQHNAEYMGDDMYYLVNDGMRINPAGGDMDTSILNSSSLMIIQVKYDEDASGSHYNYSGHVAFKYDLGLLMDVFGDFDRLFTGNALAAYWNTQRNTPQLGAQSFVEEITMAKEVAWSCHIWGNNSADKMDNLHGWRVYSAERFYLRPTISALSCKGDQAKNLVAVQFTVHNAFRENNLYSGSYRVTSADGTASTEGDFNFAPYWSDTPISVELNGTSVCHGVVVETSNRFGQSANKTVASAVEGGS